MKKWELRDHGNGVFEVVLSIWIWLVRPHLVQALVELGKDYYILSVRASGPFSSHFIITTMPKSKGYKWYTSGNK
jgi:hypothetical protein